MQSGRDRSSPGRQLVRCRYWGRPRHSRFTRAALRWPVPKSHSNPNCYIDQRDSDSHCFRHPNAHRDGQRHAYLYAHGNFDAYRYAHGNFDAYRYLHANCNFHPNAYANCYFNRDADHHRHRNLHPDADGNRNPNPDCNRHCNCDSDGHALASTSGHNQPVGEDAPILARSRRDTARDGGFHHHQPGLRNGVGRNSGSDLAVGSVLGRGQQRFRSAATRFHLHNDRIRSNEPGYIQR